MMTNDPLALLALIIADAQAFCDEADETDNWADMDATARIRMIEISFEQQPESPETAQLQRYLPLILNPLLYPDTTTIQS
jgi:hypothetical protein